MGRKALAAMAALSLALTGCGGEGPTAEGLRARYQDLAGASMEALVSWEQDGELWRTELLCEWDPEGADTIEVLSPETIAGIRAVLEEDGRYLSYEGKVLGAGRIGAEGIAPVECLSRIMEALREGWLLEEDREDLDGVPCLRLTLEESGERSGKIWTTVWLREDDGAPLRGEIALDGETVLTARLTQFAPREREG